MHKDTYSTLLIKHQERHRPVKTSPQQSSQLFIDLYFMKRHFQRQFTYPM